MSSMGAELDVEAAPRRVESWTKTLAADGECVQLRGGIAALCGL